MIDLTQTRGTLADDLSIHSNREPTVANRPARTSMSKVAVGRDGVYRMTIEERYEKMSGVRKEAKLFAVAGVPLCV